ncbi:MAG: peptide MFS transporter [Bacteroidetes bacterium]|nr:peptide MFS transporter [Bacteroidota bacterium]
MHPYSLMLIAWVAVAIWVGFVILLNRKIHPKALFALFMVELWERFSYYGMRALLVLYMTSEIIKGGFGFTDAKAYGIYAAYGALVYLTPLIGGVLADKLMGFRKAIVWGALLMALGQFTLFLDNQTTFYLGLTFLVIGNGFFKPNISSLIGKFYKEGDPKRDGAFTIFYMGINIGAFLTPLTCGAIGEIEGWKYGFLTAGIGMMLGYFIFILAQKSGWLQEYGYPPENTAKTESAKKIRPMIPYLITLGLIPVVWLLINFNGIVDIMLGFLASSVIIYLLIQSGKYDKIQKQRIWVIVILLLFTTVFWTFFELAGSALNLFTERNVNRHIGSFNAPTTFFQSVNPLFIMLFAPIFSWIWIKLGNAGKEPAAPYKFATGLILLGSGYLVLTTGNAYAVSGLVPAFFLIMLYMLHTIGELTLSPVGLSLVTKLSPAKIVGLMMGIWFLSSSIAHQGGKHIAEFTTVDEAKIIQDEQFKSRIEDKNIVKVIESESFHKLMEESSVDKSLIDESTVTALNTMADSNMYAVATLFIKEKYEKAIQLETEAEKQKAIDESTIRFLIYGNDDKVLGQIPEAEADKLINESISGTVISSLRIDSLALGMKVFKYLGYIAIGCAVILFALGPIISRWMHGIK